MAEYFHSVRLAAERCKGCTICIKRCPTEAIRVRDGKAFIIQERCIDCGECIRICPNHAKLALSDRFTQMAKYDYNVALPAPALFGQFKQAVSSAGPAAVLQALLTFGFNEVFDVPLAADYMTCAMRDFLASHPSGPWISSSCPAVVRLIQVRFPELIPNVMPMESPMEVAGQLARVQAERSTGLASDRIGVWFITPCPAKVTAVHQPVGIGHSSVNGVFPISAIYGELLRNLGRQLQTAAFTASGFGLGWGRAGGETAALGREDTLAVDGVPNLISVFEEITMGRLKDIHFLECQACVNGCVGGPLTIENPYVARVRLRKMAESLPRDCAEVSSQFPGVDESSLFRLKNKIEPRPILPLADDVSDAIERMEALRVIESRLPGLDCGACGSPSCRALAEDIVRGSAAETDCVIKLRERVRDLAEEMLELARKLPPAMGKPDAEEEVGK